MVDGPFHDEPGKKFGHSGKWHEMYAWFRSRKYTQHNARCTRSTPHQKYTRSPARTQHTNPAHPSCSVMHFTCTSYLLLVFCLHLHNLIQRCPSYKLSVEKRIVCRGKVHHHNFPPQDCVNIDVTPLWPFPFVSCFAKTSLFFHMTRPKERDKM